MRNILVEVEDVNAGENSCENPTSPQQRQNRINNCFIRSKFGFVN